MLTEEEYRARDPQGKAFPKAAEHLPPPEEPDDDDPFWLTTGRVVYHFHTRTKTGRSPALNAAAPDAFIQMNAADAGRLGVAEGDMVEVETRRGKVRAPAKLGEIIPGHLFLPFHYGHWDGPGRPRAANELTLPSWDPASKQPHFKYAAARASEVGPLDRAGAAAVGVVEGLASAAGAVAGAVASAVASGRSAGDRHVDDYIGMVVASEEELAEALEAAGRRHRDEPDMETACRRLAGWSRGHVETLRPIADRYETEPRREPRRLAEALFRGSHGGGLGLLRDLHDLWLMAQESHVSREVLHQAALALRDEELRAACEHAGRANDRQLAWLRTRIDAVAPQALIVPS